MKAIFKTVLAGALALGFGTVAANEVIISTHEGARGMTTISFDVVPSKGAAGFQFTLEHPSFVEGRVDQSKCVAELPAGMTGVCNAAEGKFGVVVFSPAAKDISGDVVPVGRITIKGANNMAKSGLRTTNVIFSDADSKSMQSSHRMIDLAAPRSGTAEQQK